GEGAPYFQDVFVFAGMTVLAAIVSERFITSLSDRVFGELDELRDQIRNPEEEDTAIPITQATPETAQAKQELDPIQSSIVAAMMAKPTTRRAIGPVAIDVMEATNQVLDRSVIETALKAIEAEGLVTRVPARNDGSPRYILDKAAPERLIKAQDGKIYLKDE
ncbi:MAG: YEATS-associated helix-containing protein, partial [Pseudomonadota bacterium]